MLIKFMCEYSQTVGLYLEPQYTYYLAWHPLNIVSVHCLINVVGFSVFTVLWTFMCLYMCGCGYNCWCSVIMNDYGGSVVVSGVDWWLAGYGGWVGVGTETKRCGRKGVRNVCAVLRNYVILVLWVWWREGERDTDRQTDTERERERSQLSL